MNSPPRFVPFQRLRFRPLAAYVTAIGMALATAAYAGEVSIAIDGISGEMADAARASLSLSQYTDRDVNELEVRRLAAPADEEMRKALEAFGYYNPDIDTEVEETGGGDFRVAFTVALGEPTIVRESQVIVRGPAAEVEEVRKAVNRFQPREGDRFEHGVYEQSKSEIATALRSTGFLDAKTTESRVEVTAASNTTNIALRWESGERYRLGEVNFSDAQFPPEFLRGFVPWEDDAFYSWDSVLTLQQRLVAADYFSAVSVLPKFDEAENGRVPVEVLLIPDERTLYTAGLFVTTDFGPGGRLGVDRRWVNRRGHKASGEIEYAPRRQAAEINYSIPRPGREHRDYTFGAAYTDEETESVRSRSLQVAAADAQWYWKGFTRTIGVQYLNGDFEIAGEQGSSSVLYFDASLARRDVDDQRFAGRGYSLRLALRGAPESFLSDTAFLQGSAAARWVREVGPGRVLLHGELGAMTVGDFNELPPELRFFAGGDRSVRGFAYEEIGDRNAAGGVIGGEYLVTGGAEYDYFFHEDWGAAVFVDAGDAFRSDFDVNVAAGIGVRWKTTVGVVRLDFARPIVSDFGESWRVHLTFGPEL